MHEITLSAHGTRTLATAPTAPAGSSGTSFQDLLKALTAPVAPEAPRPGADTVVVRPGDCLSRICADRLEAGGAAVSAQELYAFVHQVAKANHIADPNRVYPGQELDLAGTGQKRPQGSPIHGSAQPWQTLVDGAVALSSTFGRRPDPFTGRMRQHNGIDVVAPSGAAIEAFEAGRVIFSGWKSGYGQTVILHHENGLESLYGHVSKSLVQVGDQVAAHSPIANVGSNGHSTGPHLHFEVRRNGQAIDPLPPLALPQPAFRSSGPGVSPAGTDELGKPVPRRPS